MNGPVNEIGSQPQEPAKQNDEGYYRLVNLLLRKDGHEVDGPEADGDMNILEKNLNNLEEDSGFENKYYVGVKKMIRAAKRYWMLKIQSHKDFQLCKGKNANTQFLSDSITYDSYFIKCVDSLVEDVFKEEGLKKLGTDKGSLANYLIALVNPKYLHHLIQRMYPQLNALRFDQDQFRKKYPSYFDFTKRIRDIVNLIGET